jgi:hypothetical protein
VKKRGVDRKQQFVFFSQHLPNIRNLGQRGNTRKAMFLQ